MFADGESSFEVFCITALLLPYNIKALGLTVMIWHYINKMELNLIELA